MENLPKTSFERNGEIKKSLGSHGESATSPIPPKVSAGKSFAESEKPLPNPAPPIPFVGAHRPELGSRLTGTKQTGQISLPSSNPADFNLDGFRLSQQYTEHVGGEKLLTTVPVRKPSKEAWFRTHPEEDYRLPTYVIELKEVNETYLVIRELWPDLFGDSAFVAKLLIPTMTRQGDLMLWPIRLPGPDGNIDDWNASAMEAATAAREKWVRLSAKRSLGAYEIRVAPNPQAEVIWPKKSLEELVRIAFKGKIIENFDHPVLRQLRGLQ